MDIDVEDRERNDLMAREELRLRIAHTNEATPSENDVRKQLAADLDLDPLTVRIDHIYSSKGTPISQGIVTVFDEPIMDELPEEPEDDEPEEEDGDAEEVEEAETDEEAEEAEEEEEPEAEDAEDEDDADTAEEEDEEDEKGDS